MSSSHNEKVIIFGPTGAVGSHAALEASKRGAEVWLAMRDTSKTINTISAEQEKSGLFHRVQADLTDPASIKAAVEKSGAKAAFIYHAHSPKGMRDSLQSLKDSGVNYVVFLSSYTLYNKEHDIRSIEQSDMIPYFHAQVEIALEDLNIPHVAVRPGQFASNPFNTNFDKSTSPPTAIVMTEDYYGDGISPYDIGRVSGAVLVDRPIDADKKLAMYLLGPKLTNEREKWEIIKKVSGREIKVQPTPADEWGKFLQTKMPKFFADYLSKKILAMISSGESICKEPVYGEIVGNVKKYSGYEPQQYEEFMKEFLKTYQW